MLLQHDSSHISLGLQIPKPNGTIPAACCFYNQILKLKVSFHCKLTHADPLCIPEMKLYSTRTHAHTYEYPQRTPAQTHLHNDTIGC